MWRLSCFVLVAVLLGACDFQQHANERFADQHFKTVISLVELHKRRTGQYPESLEDLRFNGDWDAIAINSVAYARVGDGYRLDVTRGWVGNAPLGYPEEFWRGLGIRESNVRRIPDSASSSERPADPE